MKGTMLLASLLMTGTSYAGVLNFNFKQLEHARKLNMISSETLIVKITPESRFASRSFYLGEFKPFFKAEDGTWGYLRLNMTPDAMNASFVLKDLKMDKEILHAYFAPVPKNAMTEEQDEIGQVLEQEETSDYVSTPDFEEKQNYLKDAPVGVGAKSAWAIAGGTGRNVKVIDIETCFEDQHEDFERAFWIGNNPAYCDSTDHGTAVWGEIAAKRDGKGVTGIAHEADFGIYGFIEGDWDKVNQQYITSINKGIQGAIKELDAGDVLVIEQQMVGPNLDEYTAVEYWPHIFEQLQMATKKGIICVQAAGNGGSNFDAPAYGGAFNLKLRDSGCIMVGAIDPITRERLSFSNYGTRLDVAAFGRGVLTTGYGDLFSQGKERTYTAKFSGTSSATPIVAGAVAVVSSIAKENGRVISPEIMRAALRATGMKQGKLSLNKRVGSLPVIQQLLTKLKIQK